MRQWYYRMKFKMCKHLFMPTGKKIDVTDPRGNLVHVKECRCFYCGKLKETKFIRDINYI